MDTPLLDNLFISLFNQSIPATAQFTQFMNRAPKLKVHDDAHVAFGYLSVQLSLGRAIEKGLRISYGAVHWHVSSAAQVCTSSLFQAFSPTVERLYICDSHARWQGDIRLETDHWVDLLRPFTSVKSLYLSQVIVPRIAPALQELIGERVVGVLPALQTLFLEDLNLSEPVQEAIGSFISGRQFSSHLVAVSRWEKMWSD